MEPVEAATRVDKDVVAAGELVRAVAVVPIRPEDRIFFCMVVYNSLELLIAIRSAWGVLEVVEEETAAWTQRHMLCQKY